MTKEEIFDGNKLIAEFMALKGTVDFHDGEGFRDCYMMEIQKHKYHTHYFLEEAEFHESWDWLIPVVEKIESIKDKHHGHFAVHITGNSCSIQGTNLYKYLENSEYGFVYNSDPNAIFKTKMESVWYNVVEFIKWYNNYKKI